jgi:hypothetical protein
LDRRGTDAGTYELKPTRRFESTVGEIAVVKSGDCQHADAIEPNAEQ